MSTETLKFFEEKTTEEIINWMLSNLSEDQIRACLDQSGIPDTSVIQGKQPIAAAAAGSGPIETVTLPDGTQKQLQPGEGSSKDLLPQASAPAASNVRKDVTKIFLDKYRKKCTGTGYIIKAVSKQDGVEYYDFKEVEEGDIVLTPNVSVGEVGWVKKRVPTSEFKDFCTDEDREIFEFLKEENMDKYLGAPAEVIEASADYPSSRLVSPIPISAAAPPIDLTPAPTPVVEQEVITEPMLKALKIQQGSSSFMQETYPDLFSKGLTMFPVFVYGSDGDIVLHLTTVVVDGKLAFIKDSTNKRLLNSKFKKITASIQSAIGAGLYTPSANIQEELNEAQKSVSTEITTKISKIYDPIRLEGYTYFGTLEDEEPEWLREAGKILPDSQESFENVNSQDFDEEMLLVPELSGDSSPTEQFNMMDLSDASSKPTIGKKKKISEMSIPEIEEHMRIQFGEQYVKDYKPEKYVNSLGVTNVRYVKRPNCPPKEEWNVVTERPIFAEFQGKPSVNSGPGRFGEDSDSEEDLLFG